LEVTDILISGSFDVNRKTSDKIWVGSSNQEHHFLTDRYKSLENKLDGMDNRIEVHLRKDGSVLINGMGDNTKIRQLFEDTLKQ